MAIRSSAVSKGIGFVIGAVFQDASFYPRAIPALRKLVDGSFVRPELAYVGRPGGTLRKLTPGALDQAMKDRTNRTWMLTSSKTSNPGVSLECHRFVDDLSLKVALSEASWVGRGPTLAAGIEAMTWAMADAFGKRATFDGTVYLAFQPEIRRPKALKRGPYHSTSVVDVIDQRASRRRVEPAWAQMKEKLIRIPLPPSVRVVGRGDLTIRFWTDDLGNEKALRAACRQRQQWLVKTLWT